jgi:hypothetical protein
MVGGGLGPALTKVQQYVKSIPFSVLTAPTFGATVGAAAAIAAATITLATASEAFCDLSPVYLGPQPFSAMPSTIPAGSTSPGSIEVMFVSKNSNAQQVTEFWVGQATAQVIKIFSSAAGPKGGIVAALVKDYFVKLFPKAVAAALNALKFKYPATQLKLPVGNCDLFKVSLAGPNHLDISSNIQTQYNWYGKTGGTQFIDIIPWYGHFLYLTPRPVYFKYRTTIFVMGRKALAVDGRDTQVCASFTPTGSNPLLAGGCAPADGSLFVSGNSPYIESNILGPVIGDVSVRQIDDSTWQISATANNIYGGYSSDMSYFWEGNGFVGFTASLLNTVASDGSQSINISATQSLPACVSNLFVQNVVGSAPSNNSILTGGGALTGSLNLPGATSAVLTFGLGTFDASTSPTDPYYSQACTLNVTVQMTGPDQTATAAARPAH